jgi:uncharacterized protein YciW
MAYEHSNNNEEEQVVAEPEDAKAVANILKAVGVESFDTRVVAQLVEFVYSVLERRTVVHVVN